MTTPVETDYTGQILVGISVGVIVAPLGGFIGWLAKAGTHEEIREDLQCLVKAREPLSREFLATLMEKMEAALVENQRKPTVEEMCERLRRAKGE